MLCLHVLAMGALAPIAGREGVLTQQSAANISIKSVPPGSPVYQEVEEGSITVTTKRGYQYDWGVSVLKPTRATLTAVKYKLLLPAGASVDKISHLLLVVPPGGSAPLVASKTCEALGMGVASLQSTGDGSDPNRVTSMAVAVASALIKQNPKIQIIFSGFSMGGFCAQLAGSHLNKNCAGYLLIGNYYLGPPPVNKAPIVMLVGSQDMHLGYAEKWLAEQLDIGTNIQLIKMPGGHGYGTQADQGNAIKKLLQL
jgi:hypothetical protein